jgi:hypothetical protein
VAILKIDLWLDHLATTLLLGWTGYICERPPGGQESRRRKEGASGGGTTERSFGLHSCLRDCLPATPAASYS